MFSAGSSATWTLPSPSPSDGLADRDVHAASSMVSCGADPFENILELVAGFAQRGERGLVGLPVISLVRLEQAVRHPGGRGRD